MIIITWILSIISLVGAILNARKNIYGFYFWLVGNTGWMIINFKLKIYAAAFLWGIYSLISIWGIL
ncbi:MAG: hypothetical protein WC942_10640, partial [Clostridia bacterium]